MLLLLRYMTAFCSCVQSATIRSLLLCSCLQVKPHTKLGKASADLDSWCCWCEYWNKCDVLLSSRISYVPRTTPMDWQAHALQRTALLQCLVPCLQVISAYCQKKSLDPQTVRFLFEGNRVLDEQTPQDVGSCSRAYEPTSCIVVAVTVCAVMSAVDSSNICGFLAGAASHCTQL